MWNADDDHEKFFQKHLRHRILTKRQEQALMRRVERGDPRAKEEMVRLNLRLVASIALTYHVPPGLGLGRMDLISEGITGLIRAVEKYEWRRNLKFSTYATPWIRQRIDRTIDNEATVIRVPVHVRQMWRKIEKARRDLVFVYGREPSDEEIAELSGVSLEWIERIADIAQVVASLDRPLPTDEGDGFSLSEVIASDQPPVDHYADNTPVRDAVKALPEPYRTVVELRHGFFEDVGPMTLTAVGDQLGYTRERIRQMEQEAFLRLRPLVENL